MPTQQKPTKTFVKLELRVEQFVALRDQIRELQAAHEEKMKPYKETLDKLGGVLLNHLNTIGGESVRTNAGTVYRTTKKSCSIADLEAFWTWVQRYDKYDLLDKKANVKAVGEYLEEHHKLPPGLNWNAIDTVGVRRPT